MMLIKCKVAEGRCDPFENAPSRVFTVSIVDGVRNAMANPTVLRNYPIDALIITNDDEHQSPFVAERDKRRTFVTGYTGSYGTAIITKNYSYVWVDDQFFWQAHREMHCFWIMMRVGLPGTPTLTDWIRDMMPASSRVGADPKVIPHSTWREWRTQLRRKNITLVAVEKNPVDEVWKRAKRPEYGRTPAEVLDLKYAGKDHVTKIAELRDELAKIGVQAMVITALDEIAWLLNIRANDIPHFPVLRSYLIISNYEIHMFVHKEYLTEEVHNHLKTKACLNENCTRLHSYEDIFRELNTMSARWNKILFPSEGFLTRGASQAIFSAVPLNKWHMQPSPIIFMKAQKNRAERQGMRNAHKRDAIAMCDFLSRLEYEISIGKPWTEMKIAETLKYYRQDQKLYYGSSFPTVVAFGPNGVYPHNIPTNYTDSVIYDNDTLILDSGAQYLDGTTDVTRTLHFGTPTQEQKEMYTRILQGQIEFSRLVFPPDLPMSSIDILARAPLWRAGVDYKHSTGHGIGAFLSVHEPPINMMYGTSDLTLKEGYFLSIEPGYYHYGYFGTAPYAIQLENILEVVVKDTKYDEKKPLLGFEPVTLVPYEPKLINWDMLSNDQIEWMNSYNIKISSAIQNELFHQRKYDAYQWLLKKTKLMHPHGYMCSSSVSFVSIPLLVISLLFAISNKYF